MDNYIKVLMALTTAALLVLFVKTYHYSEITVKLLETYRRTPMIGQDETWRALENKTSFETLPQCPQWPPDLGTFFFFSIQGEHR